MSAGILTTWEQFLAMPDLENETLGNELQNGEVVERQVPPSFDLYLRAKLMRFLHSITAGGDATNSFPYRPIPDLQFWYAGVAYVPHADFLRYRTEDWPVYAPPLIAEVRSRANLSSRIDRQRLVAFSGGTREFWVIDPVQKMIEVSIPGRPSQIYKAAEDVPLSVIPGAILPARKLFEE